MKIITRGYDYEIPNRINPNLTALLHFAQTSTDGNGKTTVIRDGIPNMSLLSVMIDRYSYLNSLVPDYHTSMIVTLLKSALNHDIERQKERSESGILHTNIISQEQKNKTNYP